MVNALTALLFVLRWIHLVGGAVWVGTIVYLDRVQFSSKNGSISKRLPVESVNRLNSLLVVSSVGTLAAGVLMAILLSGLNAEIFVSTGWGISIFLGALLALATLASTVAGVLPNLERLSSETLSENELDEIVVTGRKALRITAVLGVLVLLLMAGARSL